VRAADGTLHVDNDRSLPLLAQAAVAYARAGADVVAPVRHDGRPRGRDSPALDAPVSIRR
jgi:delta-aminolevulinic acid dehydratase/porphobilinogen synthase